MRRALFTGLGALALGAVPLIDVATPSAPPPETDRAWRGGAVNCEQGPLRVTQMQIEDGYLKASNGPVERHHEFYFARAMYSEGGRFGIFGYGGDWLGDGGPGWSIDYPRARPSVMRRRIGCAPAQRRPPPRAASARPRLASSSSSASSRKWSSSPLFPGRSRSSIGTAEPWRTRDIRWCD
jgi:hypothetical protein